LCSAPAILSHRATSDGPRIILAKPFIYFSETFQNFFVIFAECWQPVWQCESAVRRANERDKKKRERAERWRPMANEKIYMFVQQRERVREETRQEDEHHASSDTHMHDGAPSEFHFPQPNWKSGVHFLPINGGWAKVTRAQISSLPGHSGAERAKTSSSTRPLVQEFILYNIFLLTKRHQPSFITRVP
jgi:hypothetical protein